MNILRQMYNLSPLNFYAFDNDKTIIKTINNPSLGYEFDRKFSPEELDDAWFQFKLHKRISLILVFILFLILLYEFIFPKYAFLVNNSWYVNALIMLVVITIVCQVITFICAKIFERNFKKKFGEYKKVKFVPSANIDEHHYKLFKMELVKILVLILVLVLGFTFISPFYCAKKLLNSGRYNETVKFTTLGIKLFPIAQEWYSMRGYANYKLGNYENAINDFDKAYELGADGFNIMNFDNKIFIKYTLKDYQSALADFDKEIEKADNEDEKDEFLWDKAQFLYNIKEYKKALEIYTELIDKAENDRIYLLKDRLYFERAQVYKELGQDKEYLEDIKNSGTEDDEIEVFSAIPKPALMLDEETSESK